MLTLLGRAVLVPVLLGAPAGLVWSAVAPRPKLLLTSDSPVYANPEPQAPIAADGWFAVITAVTAVLCGVLVFLVTRRRLYDRAHEVASLLGLALGGLGGSMVAWGTGWAVAFATYRERIRTHAAGTEVMGNLQLHAPGVIVVWPLLAVVVFTALLAAGTGRRGVRAHRPPSAVAEADSA